MTKTRVFLPTVVLLSLAAGYTATATTLDPYQTIPLNGTNLLGRPELAGDVVASATRFFRAQFTDPFVAPEFSGTVDERIVREYATGMLTFYYQVHLDASSIPVLPEFGIEYFSRPIMDVDYLNDSSGVGSSGMAAWHLGLRNLVYFFIGQPYYPGPPVSPGQSSRVFFIRTNATEFTDGGLLFLDYNSPTDVGSVIASAFQPVPEPGTFVSTALAFIAVLLVITVRFWKKQRFNPCPSPSADAEANFSRETAHLG